MNEKYQQIYNYFKTNKLTDLDANAFYNAYSDPSKSKEIWSYLKQNKMTDLDANAFHASYFGGKKKEVSQSTLDQDNTSLDRLSKTTTKPTVSSSLKGEGVYTIPGQAEGVFFKKQADGWYKKQYGVFDYKKVTDQNRIKKIEANTVEYKPQPKEELYILPSNPDALYKRSGNKWMKKVGNNYVPLTGDKISEREKILNEQAKKATKFDLDRLNVYAPGVVEKEPEQKWVDPNPKKEPSQRDTIEYWDKLLANKNIDQKTYDFHADRLASMGLYKSVVTAAKPKETADKSQELFEKTFKVYDENDPEFIRQEQIDKKLTFINSGFVGMDEEDVVSKLREVTNGYDYIEVEESGAGYDEVLVKNKITGESKKISLDNWTSDRNKEESNRLYGWLNIQMNSKDYSYAYQKVKDLTEQIRNATPYDRIALSEKLVDAELVLSKEKDKRSAKAMTDENMESAIFTKAELENVKTTLAEVQLKFEDVKAKKEDYEDWSTKAKEAYEAGKISQEDYNNIYLPKLKEEKEAIRQEAINVNNEYLQASSDKIDIDQVAASNYLVESKRGNLLTGTTYAFLKGAENSWRFLLEQDTSLNEGDLQGFLTQLAPGSVSDIYTSSEGRSTLETLVFGLAESGGSAIAGLMTGSPGGATLGFYAASYVNMKDQMNAPEFRGIPEIEKILMSATFGTTVALLEKYGLSKMFSKSPGGKGLTNWILKQVVKELPENATAEMFELAVKNNYKAALANGFIQVNAAGFIEGSTELGQESSDMVLKDVFNELNGKKYFQNPKTWGEVFDRLGTSFKLGYLGGAGMNSITQTAQTSKTEITKYQLNNIEDLITNPTTKEIYKLNIKDQVLLGNMTVKDAKKVLSNLDELEATVNKIPKEIKDESKYQAFQLLNERDNLQKEIAGKDQALVAAQTERINAINEELKTISKNAVQERSTEEVLPREPETTGETGGQREGMGQGVQGEIITEEGPITQEEKVKRISELEGMIASDNASKQEVGQGNLIPEARQSILEELQTLKESKQEVVAPKAEIGGIIRGYESISEQDNVGDVRSQLPNQNQGIAVVEGKDGNQYAVAFSRKGGDGKNIFEQGVTTPRPGYISASVKIEENATPEQVQAAQQEAQRNLDVILPTVVGGAINAQTINDVMAQQATVVAPIIEPSGETGQLPMQNVGVLITPATVRNFSNETGRLKDLSLEYDQLVKEYAETKNPETWAKVKQIESDILDNAQKEIEADVAKMPGVEVEFGKPRMGLWDGKFEPSFNMNLKVTEGSDTRATSDMLINFAEKYSQDAFIIETDSDLNSDVTNGNINVPYTEFDGDGMMHYPQISYTFANNLTDQQIAELSNKLQDSGITAFSLNDQELKISVITFLEDNLSEDEQFTRKEQEFREKLDNSADAIEDVLGDNGVYEQETIIKRSSYQGAKNEGSSEQTRQYDRGDVLETISKKEQSVEDLSKKLSKTSKESILDVDTKDATNLEKVLNALDKIEGDLDQFGKETLGVNIPVALAKTIVKAVKALVKAGITLEQAIKQVADENGLNDRDVKSLFNPTKVSEIDVNEVRSKDRPGKRISKGLSVKTVAGKKVIEETEGLSLDYVKENAPKVFISNANIIAKYPLVAGKQKFKTATTVEQAQEIYDVFVREVADNLEYLMNEFKPEYRDISTLWYDGANAIANDFAEQFDVSPEQAAGIIAAMSPQKDWYQNVRLAEMVLMAYKDNPSLSQEMIDYQKQINQTGLYETQTSSGKKLKKAEKAYKDSRTKANKEALDKAKVKLQKAINKADAIIKTLEKYLGKKMSDVPADMQPYMVRTYHEVNTTKDYNIVAPDGSIQGVATKNNGENAKVAWGSYGEIGKAVAIKNDGSQENITRSLGEMHKIRNFYNNIIDPMSQDGDVTMDTHAIAAALLLPLSGNSTQVGQNFGTKTSNSGPLGIKGLYYAYADAYALAAKEAGLLPRQVQSITWEAVRGLYTDTFKGNKAELAKINNIWKNYQDGKITINEARDQAKESAGGIKDPTWAGGPLQDESGASAEQESVGGGREGDGRNIVGSELGGEILTADTKNKTVLKKALDVLNKADQDLGKFGRETLGINIPVATMRAIIKAAKVLVKTGITLQDAIIKAAEQLNVSKQDALNAVKFMSETIKSPVKKVSVNEATALKDQLRLEARAAREAKADLNTKRKQIAAFIRSLETKGTITARQSAALVKRVSSLNLDNETMVERFEQYAEKVFQRAEYQDLLTKAFRTRRLIRKAIKSENQAEVVGMAKLFSKIDPSLVDDIDNYISLAENVLNAVRPSKQAVQDPALRQAVNIEAVAEYANEEIAKQEENRKRELMSEYKYLVDSGAITEDLSVKEMKEIISIITDPTAEFDPEADQKKLNFLQTRLASMEAVFKYMTANNINPFTGEDVVIDPKDADLIKRVLKMDLNEMSVKDAAKVVEAMDNFLMNDITSGLEAAVRSYEGAQNAKQLVDQGKKARTLKSYFNKTVGRIFGEQFISLPLLFEKMFPGIKNAANVMQKMGLVDVINGSNKAIRQHNDLMTEYSKQDFYKQKGFMEAKNVYERGMLAFLKRNLIGTETEIRDEFKRRSEIIKQSIESLRENGTDKEIQMADLYQEIYDKLDVAKLDLDVIEANADKMNKDAVAWMVNEWGKHYGDLADISLSVYNSMLGSDTNYTPDRYKSLSAEDQGLDEALLNSGSGFMMSMDYTDKNKTGVLMEATRPKVLPKGRYISLDFDVNNFNSIKGALVDINTAAAIRQVDGFTKSKAFNKLIPDAKDRKILTKRINTYIQKAKGKRTVTSDTIKDVERLANFVTGLGVGKALGGLDQPIKQTIPVIINTFINSNGNMNFVSADMNEAINRSGMPIANRGLESRTAVESIDRLLEKTGGFGAEVIKKLEDVNQFWLKTLLAKPDVWVARSSFITYYLKDMKSKGENVKDIDWSKHEWNKDSAEYAQLMVDRQQNISDDKLAGDFLSSDDPTKRIARKVIMPFATFIMNQKARMHNDLLALRSKDTSIQDRKSALKSLAGLGAELVSYQLIAYGIKTLVYNSIANALAGDDEEEKKDKSFFGLKMTTKQFNATKFPVKSIVGDILSPLPFFDDIVTMGFDKTMEYFPQISNEDINKAVEEKNAILRLKGENEMDANARAKFIEQLKSDNIYSVSFKNDSQSGRAYGMIGIAYDTYKEMIDLSEMAYSGEFEDEYQGRVIKKYLPEGDRKILQNISVPLMILYSTGIAPKDLGTVARKVTNIVKKKGITENQHEKEKEVKKEINRDLSKWEFELVKTRKKSDGVVNEINFVERNGGLTDKQGLEYVKLLDVMPEPTTDMLRDIQNGKTVDQIIKKSKG